MGRRGVVLSVTAIFLPSWLSCFGSMIVGSWEGIMGEGSGGIVCYINSFILTPIPWLFLCFRKQCLFACLDWGWKGWKTFTFVGQISGKRIENIPQINGFWLDFFLLTTGNPGRARLPLTFQSICQSCNRHWDVDNLSEIFAQSDSCASQMKTWASLI